MVRRVNVAATFISLLAVVSCTAKPSASAEAPNAGERMCEEQLGSAATGWIKDRTAPEPLRFGSEKGVDEARILIQQKLRAWNPKDTELKMPGSAWMCLVSKKDDGNAGIFNLTYGWSYAPFDHYREQKDRGIIPLSGDVLLSQPYSWNNMSFEILIRCQVPGASPEQKNRVPIVGSLDDELTGDTSARTHFTHLLHSAQVMVKALGCTNKPVIPDQLPASVK